jgi:hypothetical protein
VTEDIFEEHTGTRRQRNPRDCHKTKEGKNALANRSTGKFSKFNNKFKFCRLHGQQQSHNTGSCKILPDQADKMKVTWKTQPQQYQKNCYNADNNKRKSFQQNTEEHDNKKWDFNFTENTKTQYKHGLEKHLKQQIYHYMASVTKTNSLAKGST